jgi:cholesterol transport system auxiliary component
MSIEINRRGLFVGAGALFVAGCSDIVGPLPAPKLYVLKPKLPGTLPGPKVSWALSISSPTATSGLDGDRIAILRPPASLDYYAGAAWAGPLPSLVQSALLEAFEMSGRLPAVSRDSDGAQSDYILNIDMRDFEARYDQGEGAPLAAVRLGMRLIESRSRKIAGSSTVAKEVRASANTIDAAVEALSAALSGALADLVPWVLDRPAPG